MKFTSEDWKVAKNQVDQAQELIKHFSDYEDIYNDETLLEKVANVMQAMNLLKSALRRKEVKAIKAQLEENKK